MADIANLVYEQSTTTGTGNFTVGAQTGWRDFAAVFGTGSTTDVFYYVLRNQEADEWEVGTGHMSDATTLVRDTILKSSNADSAVDFTSGTKDVVCDAVINWYLNPQMTTASFEKEYDNGTVSSNTTIDFANGQNQVVTLGGDWTATWSFPGVGKYQLRVVQDGTGGRTLTLPTGKWPDGTADSFSTSADAEDILSIYYNGTDYYYQLSTAWA